jgi:hypothetical protein
MRNLVRWLPVVLVLLLLPALACQLVTGNRNVDVTAESSGVADAGGDVAQAGGPDGDGTTDDLPAFPELSSLNEALDVFDSYRLHVALIFGSESDAAGQGRMVLDTARVAEPPAMVVEMQMEGAFGGENEASDPAAFTFAEIEGRSYMVVPALGCLASGISAGAERTVGALLDTEEFLGEIDGATFVGQETVNGVPVYHFRFDEEDIVSGGDLRSVRGDVYVAQEDGYVVRLVADGVGSAGALAGESTETADGSVHIVYDVFDVNQPIDIEPPAECEVGSAAYPVMEGATELVTIPGGVIYKVAGSMVDVVSFYDTAMEARGFARSDDTVSTEEMALLEYVHSDGSVVTLVLKSDGAIVSVLVTDDDSGS